MLRHATSGSLVVFPYHYFVVISATVFIIVHRISFSYSFLALELHCHCVIKASSLYYYCFVILCIVIGTILELSHMRNVTFPRV